MENHFKPLGVNRQASEAEVKAAWKKQASALHPDRLSQSQEAHDAFATLSYAYSVLSDPDKRQKYLDWLALYANECGTCKGVGATYKQKGFTARTTVTCTVCDGCGYTPREIRKRVKKS